MVRNNVLEGKLDTMGSTGKKRLIVVLGMHRSGTSAITRGLQVMGIDLGNHLIPAMEGVNEKGFWEDSDINAFNNELLNSFGSDWHHVAPIKSSDIETLLKSCYFTRAVELLRQKVDKNTIFGFKDPRVAKLLPFWKEVFTYCQFDTRCILVIRHPLSVTKSLNKRDSFDAEKSYLLWLGHVIESLSGSMGLQRVLVDYDKLMKSPELEIERISRQLDFKVDYDELHNYTVQFLDKALQHTIHDLSELSLDKACPLLVQEIYTKLLEVSSGEMNLDDPVLCRLIEQWVEEFQRLKPALALVDRYFSKNLVNNQIIAEYSEQINQAVAEREAAVIEKDAAIAEKDAAIAERDAAIAERDAALARVNIVLSSKSWRITRPLRTFKKWLKSSRSAPDSMAS